MAAIQPGPSESCRTEFGQLRTCATTVLRLVIGYIPALGGENRLSDIPRPALHLGPFDLASSAGYYWMELLAPTLVAFALRAPVASRLGRT